MDRKTKQLKESYKCDTLSLKRTNMSGDKRTIISESESKILSYVLKFTRDPTEFLRDPQFK